MFWPREFHGLYSPWGHKESDTTEQPFTRLFSIHQSSMLITWQISSDFIFTNISDSKFFISSFTNELSEPTKVVWPVPIVNAVGTPYLQMQNVGV